jgi:hypothetical protein
MVIPSFKFEITSLDGIEIQRLFSSVKMIKYYLIISGFLTGVLQNHARKVGISVDSLVFNFEVITSNTDSEDSLSDLRQKLCIKDVAFTVSLVSY